MKKVLKLLIIFILIFCAYHIFSFVKEYTSVHTPESSEIITVEIPKGSSDKTIARILKDSGIIKYEMTFRIKMRSSPYRGKLNYGKYQLKRGMCLDDIIAELLNTYDDKESLVKLTIPEGFSAEMIAARCEKLGLANKKDFLDELKNGKFNFDFIKVIPKTNDVNYRLQGYLFPSTYLFKKGSSPHKIIETLLAEFEKQYTSVKNQNTTDMDMNDIIITASLIEREAKLASERRTIAGVIKNRLSKNMRLQIDASVVYAVSGGMYDIERVLYKDIETKSPYNTYKINGLPAGAICNPGLSCIKAALDPENHNYLFYHTDTNKNDGSHIFTETFSQHKASK